MSPGAPWAVCITPGPNQVLYAADAYPGRIYKVSLDGKILGVLGKAGKQPKQFGWIHEIACPSENELYVAEILNWRVQKLQLHPDDRRNSDATYGPRRHGQVWKEQARSWYGTYLSVPIPTRPDLPDPSLQRFPEAGLQVRRGSRGSA